ncbi:hypothetical protein GRQ40_03340 [Anoxybacillus sp. PDR2]|nr:hypothetical protein [Anoxybacillus rupiensis]QHC03085.1 hypothetical protein GRQ40_03340 [Anoxybacillus sp. PDR2]
MMDYPYKQKGRRSGRPEASVWTCFHQGHITPLFGRPIVENEHGKLHSIYTCGRARDGIYRYVF